MAQKKRRTRSKSRSPKRSSSRSSQNWSPVGLLLAVAVMGGVGVLAFWTKEQANKTPATSSRSVASATVPKSPMAVARPEKEVKQTVKTTAARQENGRSDVLPSPVPRPTVAVGVPQPNPAVAKPVQQASLQPVQRQQNSVFATGKAVAEPPRGVNVPGMAPSVVYARDKLVLRRSASVGAASTGSVEKGREMRSYSKSGKWHHIAVPTTGMIGWVHEDMLIPGKQRSRISRMTTGSISGAAKPVQEQAAYPPRAVGAQ
ncbi:hypothetical protein [Phyllobacterium sp. YR531]|uniref:hypothetical protein n=1 Tax=Phyllobacterium sp. YR531 TaxID=1144343 RepID=UPI00026F9837|nr:hypothetical protein [Phyllobacterium sp. YR531]EJN06088.1 hypothetical protein PMI41_00483 [Phyllobacterium sp. YR531]